MAQGDTNLTNLVLSGTLSVTGATSLVGAVTLTGNISAVDVTASGNISGVNLTSTGIVVANSTQSLSGAGAVDITSFITEVTTTGADALTLADGAEGQLKAITMIVDGGNGTLTPSNLSGGTTITFDAVGDSCLLLFTNGSWCILGGNGIAVA